MPHLLSGSGDAHESVNRPRTIIERVETSTSPTADDVVTFDSAVRWLRAQGVDDSVTILECLEAAVAEAERRTNRTLRKSVTRTVYYRHFANLMPVPQPPLQSITSVKYYNTDATPTLTTVDSGDYRALTPTRGQGSIFFDYDYTFPNVDWNRLDPVEVVVVTGWGTDDVIPSEAKAGIRLLTMRNHDGSMEKDDLAWKALQGLVFRGPS